MYAARATLWIFLDRCGLTFKKDRARGRAEPPGHPEAASRQRQVLRTCRMPLITRRSSTRGLPGLPCGRWGSIAAQASSDNQNKCVIAASLSVRLNEGRDSPKYSTCCMSSKPSTMSLLVPRQTNKAVRRGSAIVWLDLRSRQPGLKFRSSYSPGGPAWECTFAGAR